MKRDRPYDKSQIKLNFTSYNRIKIQAVVVYSDNELGCMAVRLNLDSRQHTVQLQFGWYINLNLKYRKMFTLFRNVA